MVDKAVIERANELRREYYKEWRKNNPDKVRNHYNNYWIKKAQNEIQKEGN